MLKQKKKQKLNITNEIKAFLVLTTLSFIAYSMLVPSETHEALAMKEVGNFPVAETVEPSMKNWVEREVRLAGLNWEEVYCLIKHESNWNPWAYNFNNNGSSDFGIFQINSIHKETISVENRFDYKIATKWAINKRLNDGNWSAWYGWLYHCQNI